MRTMDVCLIASGVNLDGLGNVRKGKFGLLFFLIAQRNTNVCACSRTIKHQRPQVLRPSLTRICHNKEKEKEKKCDQDHHAIDLQ